MYKKQEENKIDITKSFEFKLTTRVLFGVNRVDNLGEEVKALGVQRLLLVTDRGVVNAGLRERVTRVLEAADLNYTIFDAAEANPTTNIVDSGAEIYRNNKCEGLVALGGGSPMDAAKAIGVRATHEGDIMDYSRLSDMEAARESASAVESLATDIGIPQDLKQLGADPDRIDDLAEETMNQTGSFPFNPRKVGRHEIIQLFEQAFRL